MNKMISSVLRTITLFVFLFSLGLATIQPTNKKDLPEFIDSYRDYLIVCIHGLRSNQNTWDRLKKALPEVLDEPELAKHIFCYSFKDNDGAYYNNGNILGNRENPDNWLDRAYNDFKRQNPQLTEEQLPKKFILLTHSMGSFAAKTYIFSDYLSQSGVASNFYPKGIYQNDVKKVIYLAAPHQGSSMAEFVLNYLASDQGYQVGPASQLGKLLQQYKVKGVDLEKSLRDLGEKVGRKYLEDINETLDDMYKKIPKQSDKIKVAKMQKDFQEIFQKSHFGLPLVNINFPKIDLRDLVIQLAKINYKLDLDLSKTKDPKQKAKLNKDAEEKKENLLSKLINLLKNNGQQGNKQSNWLNEVIAKGAAEAVRYFAKEIYRQKIASQEAVINVDEKEFDQWLAKLDIEDNWQQLFKKINERMKEQGYDLIFNINISDNSSPLKIKCHWQDWTQLSTDVHNLVQEMNKFVKNYQFEVALTDDFRFKTSVEQINKNIEKLLAQQNPLQRLALLIAKIDNAPAGKFPVVDILLEGHNYLASQQGKKILDTLIGGYLLKSAIENGGVTSLLPNDPITKVLQTAVLPTVYDPILFRNIYSDSSVAFNQEQSEQFNQFFYGDVFALRKAFVDFDRHVPSALLSNAYQLKLINTTEYKRFKSSNARFAAWMLSYSRGLFTEQGDGVVELDSLQANKVKHLQGVSNYLLPSQKSKIGDYLEKEYIKDTLAAEAGVVALEYALKISGVATPPLVRGIIRITPMMKMIDIASTDFNNIQKTFFPHQSALDPECSAETIVQALIDEPLVVVTDAQQISSGNISPLSLNALQKITDSSQQKTTVPFISGNLTYLPFAYNISSEKFSLQGQIKDFLPKSVCLQYSLNFAPYQNLEVDQWGNFELNNIPVAEGQNIIAFKAVNKIGKSRNQFLRIIRSSSPLLLSNIAPKADSFVSANKFDLSFDIYNAQFISNNIYASSLKDVFIDEQEIDLTQIKIQHGQDHLNRNFLKAKLPVSLNQGIHQIKVRAQDVYGHNNYTCWQFSVDNLSPTVNLYSRTLNISTKAILNYDLLDNFSKQIRVSAVLLDQNKRKTCLLDTIQTTGRQRLEITKNNFSGQAYLQIKAQDQAGNCSQATVNIVFDQTPPKIVKHFFNQKVFSTQTDFLEYSIISDEAISGIVELENLATKVKQKITLQGSSFADKNLFARIPLSVIRESFPDGQYQAQSIIYDLAGNQTTSDILIVEIDLTPVEIKALSARPMVVNSAIVPAFSTDVDFVLSGQTKHCQVDILQHSNQKKVRGIYFEAVSGNNKITIGNLNKLPNGLYDIEVKAFDEHGNVSSGKTSIIINGIEPEIVVPINGTEICGAVSIKGNAVDYNWSNANGFEKYQLFWAEGLLEKPTDLNALDPALWHGLAINVPLAYRKDPLAKNTSYHPVREQGLLATWDTTRLKPEQDYSLLLVVHEKDLGAVRADIVHCRVVAHANNNCLLNVPKLATEIDFAKDNTLKIPVFNCGETADIRFQIFDKEQKLVFSKYFEKIAGMPSWGEPQITANSRTHLYFWQDERGAHIKVKGSSQQETQVTFNLVGVKKITNSDFNFSELNLGVLKVTEDLVVNQEKQIDFVFQETVADCYFECFISDAGSTQQILVNGSGVFLGKAQSPQSARAIIVPIVSPKNSCLTLAWSGTNFSGGYVDSGECTVKVEAFGSNGQGYDFSERKIIVQTPFEAKLVNVTPKNKSFSVFDKSGISLVYKNNRDILLTAKVFDEHQNFVATLAEQKFIAGSLVNKYLTWQGEYPYLGSNTRKTSGTYKIVLEMTTLDNQTQKVIDVPDVVIQAQNNSQIEAFLENPGKDVVYNNEIVKNVIGSSKYYWAARAQGRYYQPVNFNYTLAVKGQQLVSTNPFVPFAGIYHRGFKEIKNISIDYYIRYYDRNNKADSKKGRINNLSINAEDGSKQRVAVYFKEPKLFKKFDKGWLNVYIDGKFVEHFPLSSFNTVANSLGEKNIFKIEKMTSDPERPIGRKNFFLLFNLCLVDDINYSRLTNRYVAVFGWANKKVNMLRYFYPYWNDLGKLGFPGTTYFSDPQYIDKIRQAVNSGKMPETYSRTAEMLPVGEDFAKFSQEQKSFLEAISQINTVYETLPTRDISWQRYLGREYTEFIPLAVDPDIEYQQIRNAQGQLEAVKVITKRSGQKQIAWPITETEVRQQNLEALSNDQAQSLLTDFSNIDLTAPVELIDETTVDYGGVGSSLLAFQGTIGRDKSYLVSINSLIFDLPQNVLRESIDFEIKNYSPKDILVSLTNGNQWDRAIQAQYQNIDLYQNNIQFWSTDFDPYLKNGVIDSQALIFNPDKYLPINKNIRIFDAYNYTGNINPEHNQQTVSLLDFYTFKQYGDNWVMNPNIEYENWQVKLYDERGKIHQDLEPVNVRTDSQNVFNNQFDVRLKLNAGEASFVSLNGTAQGPYELVFYNGTDWQIIATSNSAVINGRLAWWNVSSLNGRYTLVLRVYPQKLGQAEYREVSQEVFIGKLLKHGQTNLENLRVTSPYKRVEVNFAVNSYPEDKFITVSPVKIKNLNLTSPPDIEAVGPIAEILPHGSKFPQAHQRPRLTYHYSFEDLQQLQEQGVDIQQLKICYLNENGALEPAESVLQQTSYGCKIETQLSHFSPYALLEGKILPLPKSYLGWDIASQNKLVLQGKAQPDSMLELHFDDDDIFGDEDEIIEKQKIITVENYTKWLFENRNWEQSLIDSADQQQKNKILATRHRLIQQLNKNLAESEYLQSNWTKQYQNLIAEEQAKVKKLQDFYLQYSYVSDNQQINNSTSNIELLSELELMIENISQNCQLEMFETTVTDSEQIVVVKGLPEKVLTVKTDNKGYFKLLLPEYFWQTIFVTYQKSSEIKNRPIEKIIVPDQENLPKLTALEMECEAINQKTIKEPLTIKLSTDKNCRAIIKILNENREQVKIEIIPVEKQGIGVLNVSDLADGDYYLSVELIDDLGRTGLSTEKLFKIDTKVDVNNLPAIIYLNPEKNKLQDLITTNEVVTVSVNYFLRGNQVNFFEYEYPQYLNITYNYLLTVTDTLGNSKQVSGQVVVDTVEPMLGVDRVLPADQELLLGWTGGKQEEFYQIIVENLSVTQKIVRQISATAGSILIEGLKKDTFYKVMVRAYDKAGNWSQKSLEKIIYTDKNALQKNIATSQEAILQYGPLEILIRPNTLAENALWVVKKIVVDHSADSDLLSPEAAYLIINSAEKFFRRPLQLKYLYGKSLVKQCGVVQDSLSIYQKTKNFDYRKIEPQVIDQQNQQISFMIDCQSTIKLMARRSNPADTNKILSFDYLRESDFISLEQPIKINVRNANDFINKNALFVKLNGTNYPLSRSCFQESSAKSGIVEFKLSDILDGLPQGEIYLEVHVPDFSGDNSVGIKLRVDRENSRAEDIYNVPNPMTSEGTNFTYQLSKKMKKITIKIFNMRGVLLQELTDCSNKVGFNNNFWNGFDNRNKRLSGGLYYYVIVFDDGNDQQIYKDKLLVVH